MTASNRQKKEISLERRIGDMTREVEGLTFGYIGNFESWGDDRLLMIWINEDEMREKNGNLKSLWECKATALDYEQASRAICVVRGFEAGKKYNSIQFSKII